MAGLLRRKKIYYVTYKVGGREHRRSLKTDSLQVAKEKKRQLESRLVRDTDNLFPTKTPVAEVVNDYVKHMRITKTPKGAQSDVYNLREAFGPLCEELLITSRRVSFKTRRRPVKPGVDRRLRLPRIEAGYFEEITTAQVSKFISEQVQIRGLAPKTANRYREVLHTLFNWAMKERGIRMPGDKNPVAAVKRYREKASKITFLTLKQIDEQMNALSGHSQMQSMVAVYIYAGLRREEALHLQRSDVDFNAGRFGMIRVQAKEVNGEFWEPKTKKNRAIPISSTLRKYLERYKPRPSIGDWYFPSPKGMWYEPDNFSRDLRAIQKKVGLSWSCSIYRHTFGSMLAMKGESLYKISTLMGNSPEICRRHYAALMPEEMIDSVEFSNTVLKNAGGMYA